MVTEAVHDFRSFVHSDCGGHGKCVRAKVPGAPPPPPPENQPCVDADGNPTPSNTALLRWTAHCVLGTVVRFHQGDHRFWLRDNQTQETARSYLNLRYKLAPSLIGWGNTVQKAGFPLTARCDLVWPEHPEANDPTQYVRSKSSLSNRESAREHGWGAPNPLPRGRRGGVGGGGAPHRRLLLQFMLTTALPMTSSHS